MAHTRLIGLTRRDLATGQCSTIKSGLAVSSARVLARSVQAWPLAAWFVAVVAVGLYANGFRFVGHKIWYWSNLLSALFGR